MLDQSLRASIECRLRSDKEVQRKIFAPNGTLGDTQRKVDIAYMLNAFNKDVHSALTGMTETRNLFAHNLSMYLDSEDDRMVRAMRKLELHQGKTEYPHPSEERSSSIRIETIGGKLDQLIVNAKICLIVLNGDIYKRNPGSQAPQFYDSFSREAAGRLLDRHGRPVV